MCDRALNQTLRVLDLLAWRSVETEDQVAEKLSGCDGGLGLGPEGRWGLGAHGLFNTGLPFVAGIRQSYLHPPFPTVPVCLSHLLAVRQT